jgi:hypothetical protein
MVGKEHGSPQMVRCFLAAGRIALQIEIELQG